MPSGVPEIALVYDDDAFVEKVERSDQAAAGRAVGLMGRQVAGKEFLDAYLSHGTWRQLVGLVRNRQSRESLTAFCRDHPSARGKRRRLRLIDEQSFHASFFPTPPAPLLHIPYPLEPRYAWARAHAGPGSFSLCGVTHTLASETAMSLLRNLVIAPFEPYDALICTSRAVAEMVRSVTTTLADYLRERYGAGEPRVRARLETIPLGVNTNKFRVATPEERARQRQKLGIAPDEIMVLFVGRLAAHGKAHPFAMFQGIAQAVKRTGQRVHLVLAGWAAGESVVRAFQEAAARFAPNVRCSIVDGVDPGTRFGVWHAADIFTSLSDNIQETFGLVIVEAMASGLPVVASDWNGYRDLIVNGETGYLVPTAMVMGATSDTTGRLLMREIGYDQYLADCSQAVSVDVAVAAEAYARLMSSSDLRQRMGAAGRQRAVERFDWSHTIQAYEQLWASQEAERLAYVSARTAAPSSIGPACYPAPEHSFAAYPTHRFEDHHFVQSVAGASEMIKVLLSTPLTNYASERRCTDESILQGLVTAAANPCPIARLDELFRESGIGHGTGRATVAWMLKYGLLRVLGGESTSSETNEGTAKNEPVE